MRSILPTNMRFALPSGKRIRGLLSVVAFLGALASPARAEDDGFHPLDSLLRTMDLKTDTGTVPDFVQASRPNGPSDFIPVGAQHPQGALKVKTPAEVKAAEASLDAARIRHDQLSGRKPASTKTATGKKSAAKLPSAATRN